MNALSADETILNARRLLLVSGKEERAAMRELHKTFQRLADNVFPKDLFRRAFRPPDES